MQTNHRLFDDLAKMMTGAAGAAQGVRTEMDSLLRTQVERVAGDLGYVSRDEFEAVKTMAITAREENMRLEARLAAFESRLADLAAQTGQVGASEPRFADGPRHDEPGQSGPRLSGDL